MTFAWAMRCREGVVVIADTLELIVRDEPDGRHWDHCVTTKIYPLSEHLVFTAPGGYTSPIGHVGRGAAQEDYAFDEIAQGVFDELGILSAKNDPIGRAYCAIVGGMDGSESALTRIATEETRTAAGRSPYRPGFRVGVGEILTGGDIMHWPSYEKPLEAWGPFPNLEVADARGFGVACAYAYIDERYRSFGFARRDDWPGLRGEKDGDLPGFAFPLDVFTITLDGTSVTRVDEPTQAEGDRLLALLGLNRSPLRLDQ